MRGSLLRQFAFSKSLLIFCSLLSTGISITNCVFPIPLFIVLPLVLSTTANPRQVAVHMVVFIFLSNHTFVLLSSLPYPLHTRLLSPSLAFVLPLFIILHTQYKKILSMQVYIISVLLIFSLVISSPHLLLLSNLQPSDQILQSPTVLVCSNDGSLNLIWSISPICINIHFHTRFRTMLSPP